jgi:CrcB protein
MMWIAAGGAIGAVGRYVAMAQVARWWGAEFPFGTLAVNVVGSFVLGVLIELSALAWSPSPEVRAMLVVGVLGAFTTFSTFSMDVYYLVEKNSLAAATIYVLASVALSLLAFLFGLIGARAALA